jgi:hypothetical protein
VFDKAYLSDLSEIANSEKEWSKVRKEVEEMYLKERLKQLSGKIDELEKSGNNPGLAKAQSEFSETSKMLSEL